VGDATLELEAALSATAAALDSGDPLAAAEASARAARACAELEAAGARLAPELLTHLGALQERCQATAGQAMARLGAELSTAARSSRASAAYRR
jgi:hypothetical protein